MKRLILAGALAAALIGPAHAAGCPPWPELCTWQRYHQDDTIMDEYQQEANVILELYRNGRISAEEMYIRLDDARNRETYRLNQLNGGGAPPGFGCLTMPFGDAISTVCR
jgi:hypothetical protein